MHYSCDFLVNSVLFILTGKKMFLMELCVYYCYTANNASLNALNVSALDRQNLSQYSAGPCEWYSK